MPATNAQDINRFVLSANSDAIDGQDRAAEMQRIRRPLGDWWPATGDNTYGL